MNLRERPELVDQLAASHALGTLRGRARRRFEALAREIPEVRAQALLWHERMASLTELQPAEAPSANVWKRIENVLASQRAAAPVVGDAQPLPTLVESLHRAIARWRLATLGGAFATVAAVSVAVLLDRELATQETQLAQATQREADASRANAELTARLQAIPNIQYVAVLADEKAAASMLVTFDPAKQTLMVKRVGDFHEADDRSLQLWGLPPGGGPQSLGVMESGAVMRMPMNPQQMSQMPVLAVSLEPRGGAPAGSGPTGPVLFKGPLLQTL